jgi:hypothetical protein
MPPTIDVIRPWASTGDRETPSDVKIDLGWRPGEQPAVEWENERQNLRDNILKALAEYVNAGVPISDLLAGRKVITEATKTMDFGILATMGSATLARLIFSDTTKSVSSTHDEDGFSARSTSVNERWVSVRDDYLECSSGTSTSARSRSKTVRRVVDASGWSLTAADGWYTWTGAAIEIGLSSVGIPLDSRLSHATINFRSGTGGLYRYSCPCMIQAEVVFGSTYRIANMRCACFESPQNANGDIILELDYDMTRFYP